MVRPPSVDRNGLKKGAWSKEEDDKLRAYIMRYGHWNWRLLPKYAGLARCGKSCRLRWVNYLKPSVRRGNFSEEEKVLITKLHNKHGNKWSAIAKSFPGRTDNEIKNFWHTHIKKVAGKNRIPGEPQKVIAKASSCDRSCESQVLNDEQMELLDVPSIRTLFFQDPTESLNLSPDFPGPMSNLQGNFLPDEAFLPGTSYVLGQKYNLVPQVYQAEVLQCSGFKSLYPFGSSDSLDSLGDFWTEPFLLDTSSQNFTSTSILAPQAVVRQEELQQYSGQLEIANSPIFNWTSDDSSATSFRSNDESQESFSEYGSIFASNEEMISLFNV